MPTPLTATVHDAPAGACRHPVPEPVSLRSPPLVGLVRSLHCCLLVRSAVEVTGRTPLCLPVAAFAGDPLSSCGRSRDVRRRSTSNLAEATVPASADRPRPARAGPRPANGPVPSVEPAGPPRQPRRVPRTGRRGAAAIPRRPLRGRAPPIAGFHRCRSVTLTSADVRPGVDVCSTPGPVVRSRAHRTGRRRAAGPPGGADGGRSRRVATATSAADPFSTGVDWVVDRAGARRR